MSPTEYLVGIVHPEFQDEFFRRLRRKPTWTKWEVRAEFLRAQEVVLSRMVEEAIMKEEQL
ncbi:MAG: hypothetical protein J7J52_04820 [Deltaproteobacteria bacterium]|nr:hypothetical protein [Deltaproteobacteria bacterium]